MVHSPSPDKLDGKSLEQAFSEAFEEQHKLEFGFNFDARKILIDNVRVRSVGKKQTIHAAEIEEKEDGAATPEPMETTVVVFEVAGQAHEIETGVYDLESLKAGEKL
jgi:5-oxoprolinase (ATP-hydrolysing)